MQQEFSLSLKQLEARLEALPPECEVMLLSELNGFLTSIVTCPDLIPSAEWLPFVWGGGEPHMAKGGTFPDVMDFNGFCHLVIAHHNEIAAELRRGPGHFAPLFDIDGRNDDVLWEIWLEGFMLGMQLRPASWAKIARGGDEDAASALATLVGLSDEEGEAGIFTKEQIWNMLPIVPDMITSAVEKLYAWRIGGGSRVTAIPAAMQKVGRNDPCPCDSGRKYKKCCGAN